MHKHNEQGLRKGIHVYYYLSIAIATTGMIPTRIDILTKSNETKGDGSVQ